MPPAQRTAASARLEPATLLATLPVALLAAALLSSAVASATTFVPIGDGELADRTPLIVEARVLAVEPAPGERIATDVLVAVDRPVKGALGGDALVVRVPGGVRADGVGRHVWGAPRFREGEEALLFLVPRGDGTFGLSQFLLGAFRVSGEGPARVAWRDLRGAIRVTLPGTPEPADGDRDLARFRRWLEDRAAGRTRAPDYFLPAGEARAGEAPGAKFRTIVTTDDEPPLGCGENGGHGVRWFDFDLDPGLGGRVGWRTYFTGQEGLHDGGIGAFQAALAAWTDDPNTPIRILYDGLTAAAGGLSAADGTNTLLFGDPHDEIGGRFDGAGVLAAGGPRFDCQPLGHGGERFHPVLEGDIVTQDGLELFFAAVSHRSKAAEQIFAHELGHTLGLAHSAHPEALMFADFHFDRRGAALTADDLAGAHHLYGTGELTPPAAPTELSADAAGAFAVRLEWTDNSDDESVFLLERRAAETFELAAAIAADATSFVDTGVRPTTLYAYRLRAVNAAGASAAAGEAEAMTPEDPRPSRPSNLRAAPLSSSEVRLAWQDNSDDETGFVVQIRIASEWLDIPVELPAGTRKVIVEGLTPATRFHFRVRAVNAFGPSPPSNAADAATFENDDDCAVSGEELCLLGGRFRVSVRYRNYHAGGEEGAAAVVPSTDESGLFWFFGPENVELIVKALDGRHINEHFWLFYGALSDLEYWITVTDTKTGAVQIYHNPPTEICGMADTAAFPGEPEQVPAATAAARVRAALRADALPDVSALALTPIADAAPSAHPQGACVPGPETLCLLDRRLSVEVRWRNHHDDGTEGAGRAVVDTDNSGFFWFFNLENTELVVKALDGGGLNGHLWIFSGALTDLESWITVTDTATGAQRVYHNPPGEVCGQADLEAFPAEPETP